MRPLTRAVLVLVCFLAAASGWYAVCAAAWPASSQQARALSFVALLTVAVVAFSARTRGWRAVGVTPRNEWRQTSLLVLPALLAVSPLVHGVRHLSSGTWAVLVAGYLLTGVVEELMWRGWVHRLLLPLGLRRAVLVGSALFGLAHLANLLYRDSPGLVLAQCWGAFCFGVGYAALRARTGTLVPLVVLHFLTDLAAQVGQVPAIPVLVAQDVVLLGLGLLLVRRGATRVSPVLLPPLRA
ncbi:CPBP family intramembrane glutamic endopeptidase [Nocardioides marmoribigeumensis]|jgi:membrane protease YdiL (CAAX protease family)|uniref:Membrane protease YdiL (CAAX protease family) n=1 Tax=Nocardioides marmoribigeumensis TaxID=433649 RepID=A0ABU2BPU1_9ACTN|nr:CPBP family intramembrane glutamic endopeptidase [Nocardioides marmoribigeumensis]MDR7360646.1 membrane protease YdiL (CAAX protease family) [Nocardioides marmoribigeumensis]